MRLQFLLLGMAFGMLPAVAWAQDASPSFRIEREMVHPQSYGLSDLSAVPSTRLNVDFYTGSGPVNASYTGVLLWDLLSRDGIVTDPSIKNDLLRRVVVVVGSGGYASVFSLGGLASQFGNAQVIVAYNMNDAPLSGSTGFAELVVPGDTSGGRSTASRTSSSSSANDAAIQPTRGRRAPEAGP